MRTITADDIRRVLGLMATGDFPEAPHWEGMADALPVTVTTTGVVDGTRVYRTVETLFVRAFPEELDFVPADGDRPAESRIFTATTTGVAPMLIVKGSMRVPGCEPAPAPAPAPARTISTAEDIRRYAAAIRDADAWSVDGIPTVMLLESPRNGRPPAPWSMWAEVVHSYDEPRVWMTGDRCEWSAPHVTDDGISGHGPWQVLWAPPGIDLP
jgi:hypothetical protein